MTESAQLYVQRLEEKLLLAETSVREKEDKVQNLENTQKAQAIEIEEMKSSHKKEVKTLRTEGDKSWILIRHMMRTLKKSKELMKAKERLVVVQGAKLKQVEKEVTDCKENIVTKVATMMLGIGKAANVTAAIMRTEKGNWEVLSQCQAVLQKQTSNLNILGTIASYGARRNNSLRYSEDEEGNLAFAKFCQCLPDPPDFPELTEVTLALVRDDMSWSPQWSAWKFDKCRTITLTNGTRIECGGRVGARLGGG